MVEKNYYYKAHSEHAGFSEMVAKAREGESVGDDIGEHEKEEEEGVDVKGGKVDAKVEAREVAGEEMSDI